MNFKKQAMVASVGLVLSASAGLTALSNSALASSHREAPFITEVPKVDGTDFYMFTSYEEGRSDFVTIIANYQPLQDAYGGPNYFTMDPDALYEIHIDNNGDAVEDITFQFQFNIDQNDLALDIGGEQVSIPLINAAPIAVGDTAGLTRNESYTINMVRGDRRTGSSQTISNADDGSPEFAKPVDNIGNKSIPDYAAYANSHIFDIAIPGCDNGRVFVGQRKEGFAVNLGEVFDLVNTNPVGPVDGETNTIADKNITSIALEIPKTCLTNSDDVIGAWTTASMRQARVLNRAPRFSNGKGATVEGGAWTQVSRLGSPLVNEVVIGLKDKDLFNASEPKDDAAFATYVTNPTLPALLEILFGVTAPTKFPREDLVAGFLTGVTGLNQPVNVVGSEMLRLNTNIDPVTDPASQNNLGVIAGDNAGFPNGRRPGDDVVDIALRVVMGVLLDKADAPSNDLPYTDGAYVDATEFQTVFPYLNTPIAGSPAN